jgi:hypothetical protein
MCQARLCDTEGNLLKDHDRYVPSLLPSIRNSGDYLSFSVDRETGQILNWKKPSSEDVQSFIPDEEE